MSPRALRCATWSLLFVLHLAAPASAQGTSAWTKPYQVEAAYRLLFFGQSELPLDEQGTLQGQDAWLEQRIRLQASIRRGRLSATFGGDFLSGQVAGDTSVHGSRFVDRPRDELDAVRGFELRRAMIKLQTAVGELRAGRQVSRWGYGILANGGEDELVFGDQRRGDLVERLAFVSSLFPRLYIGAGADLVHRDANASLLEGDVGINAFASVFYRDDRRFLGLYAAHRQQWDRDDSRLQVTAVDLHGRAKGRLPGQLSWEAGFEAMLQTGRTNRFRAEPELEGADVLAGGAVVRGALTHRPTRLRLSLEVGFASGDSDSADDTLRQATFHPEYRVGLILFNELLGGVSARAADRLADAPHRAEMPHGTQHLPTDGGVTGALYLWPKLIFEPLTDLRLKAGLLWALAAAELADPYTSNTSAGGYNRSYFAGKTDERHLGTELQVGASYQFRIQSFSLVLGLEYARLFPGGAFKDASGAPPPDINRVVGRAIMVWRFN